MAEIERIIQLQIFLLKKVLTARYLLQIPTGLFR